MDDLPFAPRHHPGVPHYYGDIVRVLFVISAVLIFITESIAGDSLLSSTATIGVVLALVLAAGVTNPAQRWIHSINVVIAVVGVLLFAGTALSRYRTSDVLSFRDVLISLIALLFLLALYFATRTVRGLLLRRYPVETE